MRYLNQSQFAEKAGVSRAAVSKAIKKGRVIRDPDLGIDLSHAVNREYLNSENASRTRRDNKGDRPGPKKAYPKPKPLKKVKPKPKKLPPASDKAIKLEDPPFVGDLEDLEDYEQAGYIDIDGNLNTIDRISADRLKVIETIRLSKIKRETLRNKLVKRSWVTKVFNKLYQVDQGEFRTLGDKLAPDVTAICGVNDTKIEHKINERIDEEVFKVLNHVKRILNDALKEIEAEALDEIG